MREEYELEVLERYDVEVRSTRRIRGAFFCDTDRGTMLLKETALSGRRALLLYRALSRLEQKGNVKVDTPVFTEDGELLVSSAEGSVYMLKKWYQGRECDIRQEGELARAAKELALLHLELADSAEWSGGAKTGIGANDSTVPGGVLPVGRNPLDEIRRHNRELKKVRSFVRGRVAKNEFEYLFLDSFGKMFRIAEAVAARMENSGCMKLFSESCRRRDLVHGDYNYHNILMTKEGPAITNFEHMHVDIQAGDLYYLTRKAMEKNHWKQKTGQLIVDSYEKARRLSDAEREYLALCLAYPEKYWKTASSYYHSNKAWLPEKCVEKLKLAVRQTDEKYDFLAKTFGLIL
ncbi:CotS family spore coat protein [Ruminococcus sp. CLA-AA-H200]|uniref:CotS family spore coat protein n=1 Tax=Ruminococcus turbiniformis TaxID=2881258 RepID=A0ABS8FX86_9FIRM|nr:CotS family spore coat protein [Ruminococcus turbiniformis]MCC2254199.1 CotS family spore coat protein [Ruminococcus turbiniformis]